MIHLKVFVRHGISGSTAKRQIAELFTAGILEKKGTGRSVMYRYVDHEGN
jgi:hypothetical protein